MSTWSKENLWHEPPSLPWIGQGLYFLKGVCVVSKEAGNWIPPGAAAHTQHAHPDSTTRDDVRGPSDPMTDSHISIWNLRALEFLSFMCFTKLATDSCCCSFTCPDHCAVWVSRIAQPPRCRGRAPLRRPYILPSNSVSPSRHASRFLLLLPASFTLPAPLKDLYTELPWTPGTPAKL